ncbi:MAG TPA: hypothetical protein VFF08_11240 [Trueperaceae bacterium]|nr:hypothetical protein [Trueperaceae bacterium]
MTRALSEPFDETDIKYRAGAISRDKKRAQALPYADPRVYEDRLNALVPGAWEVEFEPWGETRIICRLTIHGVTRSSTGESGDGPEAVAGTAAEAQAFKRACAKFGLGRYLYSMDAQWVDYDPEKRQLVLDPKPPRSPAPMRAAASRPSERPQEARAPRTTKGPQRLDREMALQALEQQLGLKRAAVLKDAGGSEEGIGPRRAARMHEALLGCGIDRRHHESFASEVVEREVSDLADLTDAEARLVWVEAKERSADVELPAAA